MSVKNGGIGDFPLCRDGSLLGGWCCQRDEWGAEHCVARDGISLACLSTSCSSLGDQEPEAMPVIKALIRLGH